MGKPPFVGAIVGLLHPFRPNVCARSLYIFIHTFSAHSFGVSTIHSHFDSRLQLQNVNRKQELQPIFQRSAQKQKTYKKKSILRGMKKGLRLRERVREAEGKEK